MDLLSVLGVNSTFYVQVVNFIVLVFLLKIILYKPLMQTIEQRKKDAKQIQDIKVEVSGKLEDIEKLQKKKLKEVGVKADDIIKNAKNEVTVEVKGILDLAKVEKEKLLKAYEEELKQSFDSHKESLQEEVTSKTLSVLGELVKEDPKLQKQLTDKILDIINE